jgi:hypothetical protein
MTDDRADAVRWRQPMPFAEPDTAKQYQEAWEAWLKQIEHVHRVWLGDEKLRPDQIKGLLGREARAKERYDAARLRLLGIEDGPDDAPGDGGNPFR